MPLPPTEPPTPIPPAPVLAPLGTASGDVVPVVGICTLLGETVPPGTTAFGETALPGETALGLLFGRTVRLVFTVVPGARTPLGMLAAFGTTVVLGPAVLGAMVVLGPDVFGAIVVFGPVRRLGLALVWPWMPFCALAEPGVPLGAMMALLFARCCCWAMQSDRWVPVMVVQLLPAG
jgi:hypothetical protein